jgi:hypothetical protein
MTPLKGTTIDFSAATNLSAFVQIIRSRNLTAYHAKYFAHDLTRKAASWH